jgi:hypothetical protein
MARKLKIKENDFFQCFFFWPYFMSYPECISHFPSFSTYSKSYTVHFSLSMFFIVSHDIPGPTVCISHFPCFSGFYFAIVHSLECVFLIFHVFDIFRHNPRPTV